MNRFFTFLITLVISCSAYTQNKKLRAYSIQDGLPQSQVYDIVQDEKGYLWLGTQGGGICRFNGKNFEVWNETKGLQSNYVHALFASAEKLYIGTKRGLSIKNKETFTNFEAPLVNQIYSFNDVIYLATKQGLYRFLEDEKLSKVTINPEIDNASINAIVFINNFFWVATNKGFYKLSDLKKSFKSFKKLESNVFSAVTTISDKVYAATFNDGIFVFDLNNLEDPILIREPLNINSVSIQNKNELWVTTDSYGITIINTETDNEKGFLNAQNGLKVPHIRKVITDKQSNIWIATSGGGFYKYFQNDFKHFNTNSGLKGNRIYAVHETKDGLYISNSEAGLSKITPNKIEHIKSPPFFSNVKIKTITSDKNGNIWAGSDGRGLLFREQKMVDSLSADSTSIFKVKSFKNHLINTDTGFPNNWIRKVHVGKKAIYAATYSSGIIKFNYYPEEDKLVVRKIFGKKEGIEDLYIKDLIVDNGVVFYSTQNGQLGFIDNDKVTHLGEVLQKKAAINSIVSANNKLYLGTAGKGIWWSNNDGSIFEFQKLKGEKQLTSENVYQLLFDNQGYLWAGSERGVDKIEISQDNNILDVFYYGRNDGFSGIETCLNAIEKDNNGNLWFGTLNGLTQFQPSERDLKSFKPKVYFQDVKVAYKSVDSIALKSWVINNKVLQLNAKQRQVSFDYTTVDIDHPSGIEYRTKLNESDWSPWTKTSSQDLSGLAYGAYKFSIQSRNYRWKESEPKSFSFFIETPLHKKVWFQWIIILSVIALLALLTWRYIKRLKRESETERERLELTNHLLTLEQKALRLQMNPHFIFNVLNGVKAMAVTKPDKMNITINSFASLLRDTLMNSRKDTISLFQEIKTLRHYIEVEKLMATKAFTYTINVNTDIDTEEILVPPMLYQPFVENAIRHGILKGKKEGKLSITFNTTKNKLECIIIDNGIGIYESQKNKPKTDHQSMALLVTEERLTSIAGANTLNIEEIKNEDGTIAGTKIAFSLPLETEY